MGVDEIDLATVNYLYQGTDVPHSLQVGPFSNGQGHIGRRDRCRERVGYRRHRVMMADLLIDERGGIDLGPRNLELGQDVKNVHNRLVRISYATVAAAQSTIPSLLGSAGGVLWGSAPEMQNAGMLSPRLWEIL